MAAWGVTNTRLGALYGLYNVAIHRAIGEIPTASFSCTQAMIVGDVVELTATGPSGHISFFKGSIISFKRSNVSMYQYNAVEASDDLRYIVAEVSGSRVVSVDNTAHNKRITDYVVALLTGTGWTDGSVNASLYVPNSSPLKFLPTMKFTNTPVMDGLEKFLKLTCGFNIWYNGVTKTVYYGEYWHDYSTTTFTGVSGAQTQSDQQYNVTRVIVVGPDGTKYTGTATKGGASAPFKTLMYRYSDATSNEACENIATQILNDRQYTMDRYEVKYLIEQLSTITPMEGDKILAVSGDIALSAIQGVKDMTVDQNYVVYGLGYPEVTVFDLYGNSLTVVSGTSEEGSPAVFAGGWQNVNVGAAAKWFVNIDDADNVGSFVASFRLDKWKTQAEIDAALTGISVNNALAAIVIEAQATGITLAAAMTDITISSALANITVGNGPSAITLLSALTGLSLTSTGTGMTLADAITSIVITANAAGITLYNAVTGIAVTGAGTGLTVNSAGTGLTIINGVAGITVSSAGTGASAASTTTGITIGSGTADLNILDNAAEGAFYYCSSGWNGTAYAVSSGVWTDTTAYINSPAMPNGCENCLGFLALSVLDATGAGGNYIDARVLIYFGSAWVVMSPAIRVYTMQTANGWHNLQWAMTVLGWEATIGMLLKFQIFSATDLTVQGREGGLTIRAKHDHSYTQNGHNHAKTDGGHPHALSDPTHPHGNTDGGHPHGNTDPTHPHGTYDPTHPHGNTDPGHATTQSDPTHPHGNTDPGHGHTKTDPGHTHPKTDPGHPTGQTDPGHPHGNTDPGHATGKTDPEHSHTKTDPSHTHPKTDPGHVHPVTDPTHPSAVNTNMGEVNSYPSSVKVKITNSAYTNEQIGATETGGSAMTITRDILSYLRDGSNVIIVESATAGSVNFSGKLTVYGV